MKKNILFFLWLVIGINVFAMEEQNSDGEIKKALKNVSEKYVHLKSLINKLSDGNKDDPMHKILKAFVKPEGLIKPSSDATEKTITLNLSIETLASLDAKEHRIIIALTDKPDVIFTTEWAHFLCNKEALSLVTDFREGLTRAIENKIQFATLKIKMGDEDSRLAFEIMLRMLHKKFDEKMDISPRDYLKFFFLSNANFKCDKKLIESFVNTSLAHISFTEEQIERSLGDKKFDAHRDMFFFQEHLAYLPHWAVEYFLKTPAFGIDTENSMFFLLISWAEKQFEVEKNAPEQIKAESVEKIRQIIVPMLKHIRWKNISFEYLVTVVKSVVNEYTTFEFGNYYSFALKMKFLELEKDQVLKNTIRAEIEKDADLLHYSLDSQTHSVVYEGADKRFAMKVQFQKISEWQMNKKYFSQPILSNGYNWYFFMRPERDLRTDISFLAGYLRAVGVGGPNHYLSIKSEFSVNEKNNKERKLSLSMIELEHFDRSVGLKINEPTVFEKMTLRSGNESQKIKIARLETLAEIQKDNSTLVDNDTITVIVAVQYQTLSDEKIRELRQLKSWKLDDKKIEELNKQSGLVHIPLYMLAEQNF